MDKIRKKQAFLLQKESANEEEISEAFIRKCRRVNLCNFAYNPPPQKKNLIFFVLGEKQGKPPKNARIFSLLRPPKIPGKEGENAQRSKEIQKKQKEKAKQIQKSKERKIREDANAGKLCKSNRNSSTLTVYGHPSKVETQNLQKIHFVDI